MPFHQRDGALVVDTFSPCSIVMNTQYIKTVGGAITDVRCIFSGRYYVRSRQVSTHLAAVMRFSVVFWNVVADRVLRINEKEN